MRRLPLLIVFVLVLVAACDRGEDSPGTTAASSATTVAPTTAATSGTVATTTAAVEDDDTEEPAEDEIVAGMPTYEVVERVDSDEGEELVVVVEPGTYTNVELQNLVYDIVDRFAPVTAVVVDNEDAVALVFAEGLTPEQESFLDEHTFLHLENGIDVTFLGPYSDMDGLVIGS